MSSRPRDLDADQVILVLLSIIGGPVLLGAATTALVAKIPGVARWLVDVGILAPAANDPILEIPYSGGAGLDWPRLIAAAAVLLICLVWAGWTIRARTRTTQAAGHGQ